MASHAAPAARTAAEDFAFCQVVRCAESGLPCPDGAPCVTYIPDCDGDGLTDDLEWPAGGTPTTSNQQNLIDDGH